MEERKRKAVSVNRCLCMLAITNGTCISIKQQFSCTKKESVLVQLESSTVAKATMLGGYNGQEGIKRAKDKFRSIDFAALQENDFLDSHEQEHHCLFRSSGMFWFSL